MIRETLMAGFWRFQEGTHGVEKPLLSFEEVSNGFASCRFSPGRGLHPGHHPSALPSAQLLWPHDPPLGIKGFFLTLEEEGRDGEKEES